MKVEVSRVGANGRVRSGSEMLDLSGVESIKVVDVTDDGYAINVYFTNGLRYSYWVEGDLPAELRALEDKPELGDPEETCFCDDLDLYY